LSSFFVKILPLNKLSFLFTATAAHLYILHYIESNQATCLDNRVFILLAGNRHRHLEGEAEFEVVLAAAAVEAAAAVVAAAVAASNLDQMEIVYSVD
jgi:hypothetical protein